MAVMLLAPPGFSGARADGAYPDRAVKVVVSFPPGSPTDTIARIFTDKLQAVFKQPFIVDNKPGSGGNIGADIVAKSAPDGYTLLVGLDSIFTVNPTVYPSMPFRTSDFRPVLLVASSSQTVAVNGATGINTLTELIARGRAQSLNFSSGGNGSPGHITSAILAGTTGMQIQHIPYRGNPPAVLALLSGEVQAGILSTPGLIPHLQAGKIKALAVTGKQRSAIIPAVPTTAEAGLPELEFEVLFLVMAPAKTPDAVTAALQKVMLQTLALPEVKERLVGLDLTLIGATGPAVMERLAEARERYAKPIKTTGMKID